MRALCTRGRRAGECALYLAPALIISSTSFTQEVEVLLRVTAERASGSLRALIHADLSDGELVVLTK